jgi:hypothetical protein
MPQINCGIALPLDAADTQGTLPARCERAPQTALVTPASGTMPSMGRIAALMICRRCQCLLSPTRFDIHADSAAGQRIHFLDVAYSGGSIS